jgi:hypothetical protein
LHGAIPEGCLGAAALVALGWRSAGFGCGIHGIPHWAWMGASIENERSVVNNALVCICAHSVF